jgi:hypothetical protein
MASSIRRMRGESKPETTRDEKKGRCGIAGKRALVVGQTARRRYRSALRVGPKTDKCIADEYANNP